MRTTTLFLFCTLWCRMVPANDGVYRSSGGILYPLKETRIELRREVLSFKCRENRAEVHALLEFHNPDDVPRRLTVGFQAFSDFGVDVEQEASQPPIGDLVITHNDTVVTHSLWVAQCEDCPLAKPGTITFNQEDGGIFVHLFEVTFLPGTNRIGHSYTVGGGGTSMGETMFHYILRTGAKWAGGRIGEFRLLVDAGPNAMFSVADVLGPEAVWAVVGVGKVSGNQTGYHDNGSRDVRIISGMLEVSAKDLLPDHNIEFVIPPLHHWLYRCGEGLDERIMFALRTFDPNVSAFGHEPLAKEELRDLRDFIHARHGYAFSDPEKRARFAACPWYIPDPALRLEDIRPSLSLNERLFVGLLTAMEEE